MAEGTGRPEDDVPCPACGHGPGDSCDAPASHPSRLMAHVDATRARATAFRPERVTLPVSSEEKDWVIGDVRVVNRCGFCGEEFGVRAKHVCSKAAIDPVKGTMLTAVELPEPKANPGGAMDFQVAGPTVHRPVIARTLMEGPGNQTLVRGCACGAEVMSAEAYAYHVAWPVEAVRALLRLVGIVDDLIIYRDHEIARDDLWQQINNYLEVRR